MTAVAEPAVKLINRPGVYDLPADLYHCDPVDGGSLSSSGARKLLPPSCPALFDHERRQGRVHKREFDLGHAAHTLVLGRGAGIVRVDAADYKTKAARQTRDDAHANGQTPILEAEYLVVEAMAKRLREHPIAAALFDPASGKPEQTIVWQHRSGIWCRALVDWLRHPNPGGRYFLPDYKTAHAVDLDALQRAIYDRGYHQQGAWYLDAAQAVGYADDRAEFVLVCQMKTAPYLVTVVRPDPVAIRIGREQNREAIGIYRECLQSGQWPGFSDSIEMVPLPPWAENRHTTTKEIW